MLVKIFGVFLALVIVFCLAVWLFFPQLLLPKTNKNLLFINLGKNSQIGKTWLVSYQKDRAQVQPYVIEKGYSFRLVDKEREEIVELNLEEFDDLNQETWTDATGSFLVGLVVDELLLTQIDFSQDLPLKKMAQQEQRVKLQQELSQFRLKSFIESAWQLAFLWRAEWLEEKPLTAQTNLPSSLSSTCPTAIINTTKISGYAALISEILEQSGARVIRTDANDELSFLGTALLVNEANAACIHLVQAINRLLLPEANVIFREDEMVWQQLNRYRADLVIVLGE